VSEEAGCPPSQRSRASATRTTSSPAAKAGFRRTRGATHGMVTTSSRSATFVEDLTHNFFLETGALNNKLKARRSDEEGVANGLGRMAPSPRNGPGLADSPKSAPSYPRRLKA
jgi:hypothetical protein